MPVKLFLILALLVAVGIAAVLALRARKPKREFVIGGELASARENEVERLKRTDLDPSPIPPDEYAPQPRSFGLLNPQPVELDAKLQEICRRYRQLDGPQRERVRTAISMEELYRLLEFAKRMAVFGLRSNDPAMVADACAAVSMIDVNRIDYRDLLVAASILRWTATRLGNDATTAFESAVALADPKTQKFLIAVRDRVVHEDELLESMGYRDVETKFGRGLVKVGHRTYAPTRNLLDLALAIADVVDSDVYSTGSIEIATELPDVWMKTEDNASLQTALREIVGTVTIGAALTSGQHPKPEAQHFVIFLAETQSAKAAKQLATIAAAHRANWHFTTAASRENVFCLVVARSYVDGVSAFETADTIQRFGPKIQEALETQP